MLFSVAPTIIAQAKSRMTPVPMKAKADTESTTVVDVRIVRESISLTEMLITSSMRALRRRARFSRMRSYTMMVSFIE